MIYGICNRVFVKRNTCVMQVSAPLATLVYKCGSMRYEFRMIFGLCLLICYFTILFPKNIRLFYKMSGLQNDCSLYLPCMKTTYFIIPGLGNSGEGHWQTHFEYGGNHFTRIEQNEWDAPKCEDWIQRIDEVLSKHDLSNAVLVGHSLGCVTIAHWAKQTGKIVRGALLVAPSDLEAEQYQKAFPAQGFTPIPREKINFPTIVVTSEDDPWISGTRARYFAEQWGSKLISLGNAGHINVSSGYGVWPQGLEILNTL